MRSDLPPLHALALLLGVAACVTHPEPRVRAQAPLPGAVGNPTLEHRVAELERASEPGPEHHALDPLVGDWLTVLSSVGADGGEVALASGTTRVQWVLDARYLRWEATLEVAGIARQTSGFLGFDRRAANYVYFTVTSLSTVMSIARGVGELARGGIRFELEQVDPRTSVVVRMKSVLRLEPGGFVLDQLGPDEGGREHVVQRTRYRRADAPAAVTR